MLRTLKYEKMGLQHRVTILQITTRFYVQQNIELLPKKLQYACKNRCTISKSRHACKNRDMILTASEHVGFAIFCHRSSPKLCFLPQLTQIFFKHHPKVNQKFKH